MSQAPVPVEEEATAGIGVTFLFLFGTLLRLLAGRINCAVAGL